MPRIQPENLLAVLILSIIFIGALGTLLFGDFKPSDQVEREMVIPWQPHPGRENLHLQSRNSDAD